MKTFFASASPNRVRGFASFVFGLFFSSLFGQNQPPALANVSSQMDLAASLFHLNFDLFDAENDSIEVVVELSDDGGQTFAWSGLPLAGDIGWPVFSGAGKKASFDFSSVAGMLPPEGLVARVSVFDRRPFDFSSLVAAVDEQRLLNEMKFMLGKRHRTAGAAHLAEVQDSLKKLMKNRCLALETKPFTYPNYQGQNIIGKQRGLRRPGSVVIIDGHYDTVATSPGADDNGSGTVGMMEAVRVLSRFPCRNSLFFIGFDLEETGLTGSKNYNSAGIPATDTIAATFNFEMIGYFDDAPNTQSLPSGFQIVFPAQVTAIAADTFKGNFITLVSNGPSAAQAAAFEQAAAAHVPGLKVVHLPIPGNGLNAAYADLARSDHAAFWQKNRPAIMLTDGAEFRNPNYHGPADTLGPKFNFHFMGNVIRATVAAAAQLAGAEHGSWAVSACPLPTVKTSFLPPDSAFRSWPNPARGELFFEVGKAFEGRPFSLQLVDNQGVTVFSKTILNEKKVSLPPLEPGFFMLLAEFENGQRATQKIMIR